MMGVALLISRTTMNSTVKISLNWYSRWNATGFHETCHIGKKTRVESTGNACKCGRDKCKRQREREMNKKPFRHLYTSPCKRRESNEACSVNTLSKALGDF